MENYYIECECQCPQHLARIVYEEDTTDGWNDIYIDLQLNQRLSFMKRLVEAFKYVFKVGQNNRMPWDCVIIKESQIPEIIKLLQRFKRNSNV